jgi:hypothetical protein
MQLQILKKNNRFGIPDLATPHHSNGLFKSYFEYFNFLFFLFYTTPFMHFHRLTVFCDKKIEDFTHGTRRHIGFKYFFRFFDPVTGFFFGFPPDGFFRIIPIQQAGIPLAIMGMKPGIPDPRAILHHSKERRVAQEISDQRTLVAPAGPMVE